jgi:hypothetical protein
VARFDVYRNPNPRASHALYLDVQSDLVRTSTRWCVPLMPAAEGEPGLAQAQAAPTSVGDLHLSALDLTASLPR